MVVTELFDRSILDTLTLLLSGRANPLSVGDWIGIGSLEGGRSARAREIESRRRLSARSTRAGSFLPCATVLPIILASKTPSEASAL